MARRLSDAGEPITPERVRELDKLRTYDALCEREQALEGKVQRVKNLCVLAMGDGYDFVSVGAIRKALDWPMPKSGRGTG